METESDVIMHIGGIENKYLRRSVIILAIPFTIILGVPVACYMGIRDVFEEMPGAIRNAWEGPERYGSYRND